jgi:glycogen debranching enzyme
MGSIRKAFLAASALAFASAIGAADPAAGVKAYDRPEYLAIKKELLRGWGTWDSRDALAQVHLPDGLSVGLSFRRTGGADSYSKPQMVTDKKGSEFRAGMHALDGSYSEADIDWKGTRLRVQSATEGDDLVILATALGEPKRPVEAVVAAQMLWNRPGVLSREDGKIIATLPGRLFAIYVSGHETSGTRERSGAESLSLEMKGKVAVSTGTPRTIEDIEKIIGRHREALQAEAASHGDLAEAYDAIRAGIGWSTIYDPGFDRIVTVVSREWNKWFGGYVIFGWDNFFLSYACSLFSRELAYANFAEHMRSLTPEGFIPNVDETGGKTSWDRSQPPVGSLMLKEIFKRCGDRWILEASFDDLLSWNRWWVKRRMNGALLGWGSDLTGSPLHEKEAHTAQGAAWESGMDDSPMFQGVPFNPRKSMFESQDVGLNGLYVADCRALAEIADVIGRKVEAAELRSRAERISRALEGLWAPAVGLYLNRRTDTGEFSKRISPTMFYPLIGRVPTSDRAKEMVDQHLMNPTEFGGEYVLPSIARNDAAFPKQHYWKGAVWPPLNFLVYLGLRNYNLPFARQQLAEKSMAIFLGEWRRKGFISENYSALTGTGDDPHLTSTSFYSWGVLMGMIGFIEAGQMPPPEAPIGVQSMR